MHSFGFETEEDGRYRILDMMKYEFASINAQTRAVEMKEELENFAELSSEEKKQLMVDVMMISGVPMELSGLKELLSKDQYASMYNEQLASIINFVQGRDVSGPKRAEIFSEFFDSIDERTFHWSKDKDGKIFIVGSGTESKYEVDLNEIDTDKLVNQSITSIEAHMEERVGVVRGTPLNLSYRELNGELLEAAVAAGKGRSELKKNKDEYTRLKGQAEVLDKLDKVAEQMNPHNKETKENNRNQGPNIGE